MAVSEFFLKMRTETEMLQSSEARSKFHMVYIIMNLFSIVKICEPGAWSRGPVAPRAMADQPLSAARGLFRVLKLAVGLLGGRGR
jgi:hypothetical protein